MRGESGRGRSGQVRSIELKLGSSGHGCCTISCVWAKHLRIIANWSCVPERAKSINDCMKYQRFRFKRRLRSKVAAHTTTTTKAYGRCTQAERRNTDLSLELDSRREKQREKEVLHTAARHIRRVQPHVHQRSHTHILSNAQHTDSIQAQLTQATNVWSKSSAGLLASQPERPPEHLHQLAAWPDEATS